MRRYLLPPTLILFFALSLVHGDPWWQPEGLQMNIIERLVKHIEKTTPYRIEIQKIGGNFFKVFSLEGVTVRVEGKSKALLTVKTIQVDLRWKALLQKHVEVQSITFDEPVAHLRMGKDGKWEIPKNEKIGPQEEEPSWNVERIELRNGQVLVTNASVRPVQEMTMRKVLIDAQLTPERLTVSRLESTIGQGRLSGHVTATWNGAQAPKGQTSARGQVRFIRPALNKRPEQMAYVTLNIARGRGPVHAMLRTEGLLAHATAELNLPGGTSRGKFHVSASSFTGLAEWVSAFVQAEGELEARGSWSGPLKTPTVTLAAKGKELLVQGRFFEDVELNASGPWEGSPGMRVTAELKDMQWSAGKEGSWDIASAQLEATSRASRWQPTLNVMFRNKSELSYAGEFRSDEEKWTFMWDKIRLKPNHGAAWETAQPGSLIRDSNGAIRGDRLLFASGEGRLFVEKVQYVKPRIDIRVSSNEMDTAVLGILNPDGRIASGGEFNVNGHIHGTLSDMQVDGRLRATFPQVKIPQAGLDLKNGRVDIVSEGKVLEVKEFTAYTKKGKIEMTGKSMLPALDFRIVGESVVLGKPKELDVEGKLDVRLEGSLESPKLTGQIALKKGTYRVPQKSKKVKAKQEKAAKAKAEKPVSPIWASTVLDIKADWPRSVWYRDGLSKIETSADLRIQKETGQRSIYMTGSIRIIRGSYDAYGRDFALTSGDIAFTGPPDINPLLNIQAEYKSAGTVVYLDVRGTAKAPEITLRSNPPLAQQDIVSVLVLGRPLSEIRYNPTTQATGSSGQAEALAGSVLSSMITRELRDSGLDLGLDVVRIEPTIHGNVLMVGRYIGTNIFVAYGQPLQATASRAYEASYYFSPNWTLVGESGTPDTAQATPTAIDNHMGLEFRYPLNK